MRFTFEFSDTHSTKEGWSFWILNYCLYPQTHALSHFGSIFSTFKKNGVNRLENLCKVKYLLSNVNTSFWNRKWISTTTPSILFLTTNIAKIQHILLILWFWGRVDICKFYRSKTFLTAKLVEQKKLNVKLDIWIILQLLVQDLLSRQYSLIVNTCW